MQSDRSEEEVKSSRVPSKDPFKQQTIPVWQPVLTARNVYPYLFCFSLLFIPIGIGLFITSSQANEYVKDYTRCHDEEGRMCLKTLSPDSHTGCKCIIPFTLPQTLRANVYMYYRLTNFYQNHRMYVRSRDDRQLQGKFSMTVNSQCAPFDYHMEGKKKLPYFPCGAIANSMFNDTLTLQHEVNGTWKDVILHKTGIVWDTEKKKKFKNPDDIEVTISNSKQPRNWIKNIFELDPDHPENNGLQNEDFIIWMRTAAFPTFRKPYRHVDHSQPHFHHGMPKDGKYRLVVEYNFPVHLFNGTKSMILSTTSFLGARNPFTGIAYIVTGIVCLLMSVVLVILHKKYARITKDSEPLVLKALY